MRIAIITGASSGLGAEYARLLAEETGLEEIRLIARRKERLEMLARSLPLPCRLLPLDLTREESLRQVRDRLQHTEDLTVNWLINAAGFGRIGSCETIGVMTESRMIELNCRAATAMTELCLPHMKEGSHIIEVCSCAAFQPIPYLTTYAATKAFLLRYSRGLCAELAPRGISVTAVCPYWIRNTEFIAGAKETDHEVLFHGFPLATDKHTVARRSLHAAQNERAICTPDLVSTLDRFFGALIPDDLIIHLVNLYRHL